VPSRVLENKKGVKVKLKKIKTLIYIKGDKVKKYIVNYNQDICFKNQLVELTKLNKRQLYEVLEQVMIDRGEIARHGDK